MTNEQVALLLHNLYMRAEAVAKELRRLAPFPKYPTAFDLAVNDAELLAQDIKHQRDALKRDTIHYPPLEIGRP